MSAGSSESRRKLLIVAGLLVVIAGALGWTFGLFGGGSSAPKPPSLTPEEQQAQDESIRLSKERTEQLQKDAGTLPAGGGGPG